MFCASLSLPGTCLEGAGRRRPEFLTAARGERLLERNKARALLSASRTALLEQAISARHRRAVGAYGRAFPAAKRRTSSFDRHSKHRESWHWNFHARSASCCAGHPGREKCRSLAIALAGAGLPGWA